MKNIVTLRAVLIVVAIGAMLVTLTKGVISKTNGPRGHAAHRIVLVSATGQKIPGFFEGLQPIPAYINGKMYPKERN
jgi:hypothetical protein